MITAEKPRPRHFRGEKTTYSIRFPKDLYDYYTKIAEESGRGIAEVMADVLDEVAEQWINPDTSNRPKNGNRTESFNENP